MGEIGRRRPRRQMLLGTASTSRAASLLSCACLTIGNVDGFLVFAPPVPAARASPPPFPLARSSTCSTVLASSRESTADQHQRKAERTTYYDTLGVSERSDMADIKRQYKRLARMTHPDALIGNDPSSSAAAAATNNQLPDFYEISTAYKVLSDPQKRKKYDRELAADQFVEGTAELAESVGATLGVVVPFVAKTAKATVKAAAKTATVVKNTSDQVQENLRKAREEEAERRRQQKLDEERLRAEINEKMRRREEERLRLEAERAERERLEAERIATDDAAQKAEENQAKQQSELEKKFLQFQAEEMLEKKTSKKSTTARRIKKNKRKKGKNNKKRK